MQAEQQSRFDAALRGGSLPPGVTATDPAEAARRFAVYRNNVTVSLTEALVRRFPVIMRLVGATFFRATAQAFVQANRPHSPVLAEWGEGFPAFLATFPPLAAWPYMADVARIEYARGRAFHAADARPLDPAALTGADPASLRLALHPSVAVLRLSCPAVSIWSQNQPSGQRAPLPVGAETALILRDPAFSVQVEAISPGDAALIRALLDGQTLAHAAGAALRLEPGHDPQPRLVHLMRAGAITAIKE